MFLFLAAFSNLFNGDELNSCLENVAKQSKSFDVSTAGYNHFGESVWVFDVEQIVELSALRQLMFDKMTLLAKESGVPFDFSKDLKSHCHCTLAYKDLNPVVFKEIGEFLKANPIDVPLLKIDGFSLFDKIDGKWVEQKFFRF